MKIHVKLGAPLSQVVGQAQASLELAAGATAEDMLDALQARYPDLKAGLQGQGLQGVRGQVPYTLFVNARPVAWTDAARTVLREGDRVYFFLPIAGG